MHSKILEISIFFLVLELIKHKKFYILAKKSTYQIFWLKLLWYTPSLFLLQWLVIIHCPFMKANLLRILLFIVVWLELFNIAPLLVHIYIFYCSKQGLSIYALSYRYALASSETNSLVFTWHCFSWHLHCYCIRFLLNMLYKF